MSYNGMCWSYEIPDCSMPIRLDTYSRCSFNCLYCFSFFKPTFGKTKLCWLDIERIKKIFSGEAKTDFYPFIKQRKFIQWGGVTDPFDKNEDKNFITLQLLNYFKSINYPFCFSTKGTSFVYNEAYRKLISNQKNWFFKFSIINLDPKLSAQVELGTDSPQERLKAIRQISKLKCGYPILRLRPFIIGMSDKKNEYLDLIRQAKNSNAKAVSMEFLCLENRTVNVRSERLKMLNEALGFDLQHYYARNSTGEGYLRLSREIKRPYVVKMYELCQKLGLKFYVSDADWKDLNYNGCCCGLPDGCNYFKMQFTEIICQSRQKKEVNFDDFEFLSKDDSYKKMLLYRELGINSNNIKNTAVRKKQSLFEWFHEQWNNLNTSKGLYKGYGRVMLPVRVEKGNIVYKYDGFKGITGLKVKKAGEGLKRQKIALPG